MKTIDAIRSGASKISVTGVVSCVLVVAGLVLGATVDMGWLVLFGLGAFGPSVLRVLGLLDDLDEFQKEAARRAALHAYLAGGLFLCTVAIAKSWGDTNLDHDAFSASSALAVLVVAYFMSRLLSYWGAAAAASRVLVAFGMFWLAFALLSHPGFEGLMEAVVALPFFLLAFTCRRWPRATGVALLAAAAFAFWLFNLARAFEGNQGAVMVIVVFVIPLAGMGAALLAAREDGPEAVS